MATLKLRQTEANVTKTCSDNLDSVSQKDLITFSASFAGFLQRLTSLQLFSRTL